jgi:hypothetical protein
MQFAIDVVAAAIARSFVARVAMPTTLPVASIIGLPLFPGPIEVLMPIN